MEHDKPVVVYGKNIGLQELQQMLDQAKERKLYVDLSQLDPALAQEENKEVLFEMVAKQHLIVTNHGYDYSKELQKGIGLR